jgi:hypothetical protein
MARSVMVTPENLDLLFIVRVYASQFWVSGKVGELRKTVNLLPVG